MATTESSSDVIALLVDHRVFASDAAGPRGLPEVHGGDGWTDLATLVRAAGDPAAVSVSPTRQLDTEPRRFLNVLSGGTSVRPDGHWLGRDEVDQLDQPADVLEALGQAMDELSGRIERPPLRPDWYRPGWRAEVDAWVDDRLAELGRSRTGASSVLKLWSLSAILRIPCSSGAVYFKATCDHFKAEAEITRALSAYAPKHVPTVLAIDRGRAWMLMEPLPGTGGSAPDGTPDPLIDAPVLAVSSARALAEVQQASLSKIAELGARGCPDRGLTATLGALHEVIEHSVELPRLSPEQREAARRMKPWLAAQIIELYDCGLPLTVGHGDLYLGNVAADGSDLVFYDWTDACITHPFLDAAHLAQSPGVGDPAPIWRAFSESWQRIHPEADLDRAIELAPLVERVFQTISYEGIYRMQEPASRWEMAGTVAKILGELAAAHATVE